MVRVRLVLHEKITDELGNTVEKKIWQVPVSEDKPRTGTNTPWSTSSEENGSSGMTTRKEKGITGISRGRNPPIRSGAFAA